MKKIIILIALILMVLIFAGCSSDTDTDVELYAPANIYGEREIIELEQPVVEIIEATTEAVSDELVSSVTENAADRSTNSKNPDIVRALAEGFPDRWNYLPYEGFHDIEDVRSYLILFLSNAMDLTVYGSIEQDIYYDGPQPDDEFRLEYRFFVTLDSDTDSEVMIFYVNSKNFQIRDQYGTLLNPDGWPWPLPERLLTQEEAKKGCGREAVRQDGMNIVLIKT